MVKVVIKIKIAFLRLCYVNDRNMGDRLSSQRHNFRYRRFPQLMDRNFLFCHHCIIWFYVIYQKKESFFFLTTSENKIWEKSENISKKRQFRTTAVRNRKETRQLYKNSNLQNLLNNQIEEKNTACV